MRRLLLLLLAALAVLAPHAVAQQDGAYGIRLLDAPSDRKDDPRARLYVVDHLAQGERITRRFSVNNGTARPVRLQLYATAASVDAGSFVVADGRTDNELVSWTTVTPSSVELAPGTSAVATLQVAVPRGAEDGERYATVVAEAPPVSNGGQVAVGSRVGIRMYVDVGSGAEPASDFTVDSLQASRSEEGRPEVTARVTNTGGRALDLSGQLALSEGPGGLSAGPFEAELGTTLAPGKTAPVRIVLSEAISGGPWRAVLTLRSGRIERAAEARITFPDEAGVKAQVITARELPLAEDPSVVIPVAAGLLGLAVLLLLVALVRRRTRSREPEPAG